MAKYQLWAGNYHFRFFGRVHLDAGIFETHSRSTRDTVREDIAEFLHKCPVLWKEKGKVRAQIFENKEDGPPVHLPIYDHTWDMETVERMLAIYAEELV